MASFSYATHVRVETGQKRPLASAVTDDLTSAAKRTASPFSGTAARPDRGTNATMPVARWSYDPLQEGDVAFVNATGSSGVRPGFFLQSVSMQTLNAMMAQDEFLVSDPQSLLVPTLARHSYVCKNGVYERSSPTNQFSDKRLEANHPARSYMLEGVVCAKTDALAADAMIDTSGAEGVVAVGGLSALNTYNESAMSNSRVLDHVYVVLMSKMVRAGKHKLQFGLINSLHVWHGHVSKHFGDDAFVLKVWRLGRIVDTNYARDRAGQKMLKMIVAMKPLVARRPAGEGGGGAGGGEGGEGGGGGGDGGDGGDGGSGASSGMVPADANRTLEEMALPKTKDRKRQFYQQRRTQTEQQEQCKKQISTKKFAALRMSPGLTTEQRLEIEKLRSQLDVLRNEAEASKKKGDRLTRELTQLRAQNSQESNPLTVQELERQLREKEQRIVQLQQLEQQPNIICPTDEQRATQIVEQLREEDANVDEIVKQLDRGGCIKVLKRLLVKRVHDFLTAERETAKNKPGVGAKDVEEKRLELTSLFIAIDDMEDELPDDIAQLQKNPYLQTLSTEANAYFTARLGPSDPNNASVSNIKSYRNDVFFAAVLDQEDSVSSECYAALVEAVTVLGDGDELEEDTLGRLKKVFYLTDNTLELIKKANIKLLTGVVSTASDKIGQHVDKSRETRKNALAKAAQEAKDAQEAQLAEKAESEKNKVTYQKSAERIKKLSETFVDIYLKAEEYINSGKLETLANDSPERQQLNRINGSSKSANSGKSAYSVLWKAYANPRDPESVTGNSETWELRKLNNQDFNERSSFEINLRGNTAPTIDYDKWRLLHLLNYRIGVLTTKYGELPTPTQTYHQKIKAALKEKGLHILTEKDFNTLLTSGTDWMKVVDPGFAIDRVVVSTVSPPPPPPPPLPPPPPAPPAPPAPPSAKDGPSENALFQAIADRRKKAEERAAAIERGDIKVEDPRDKTIKEFKDEQAKNKERKANAKKRNASI